MDDSIFDKFSKTIFSIRGRYKYTVNLWNLLPIYLLSPRVVIGSIDPSSGINWCQWMSMAKTIFVKFINCFLSWNLSSYSSILPWSQFPQPIPAFIPCCCIRFKDSLPYGVNCCRVNCRGVNCCTSNCCITAPLVNHKMHDSHKDPLKYII